MCAKNFMRSKLPISKNKETISEQTSRKYALLCALTNKVTLDSIYLSGLLEYSIF